MVQSCLNHDSFHQSIEEEEWQRRKYKPKAQITALFAQLMNAIRKFSMWFAHLTVFRFCRNAIFLKDKVSYSCSTDFVHKKTFHHSDNV